MVIRLDALPITHLPQITKAEQMAAFSTRITCLLQSGSLPPGHHLEAQVNGVRLEGMQEDHQQVFSWQFLTASDEVRINLVNQGATSKHWQGRWNERDAILSAGTLPVQVSFNGKRQPTVAMIPDTELVALSSPVNGHQDQQHEADNGGQEHGADGARAGASDASHTLAVQEMLVAAETHRILKTPEEPEVPAIAIPTEDEGWVGEEEELEDEENLESEVEDEETLTWEDEERMPGEGDGASEPALPVEESQVYEGQVIPKEQCVVAFHAGPASPNKTLQALKDLVSGMPARTILVDLRQQSRKPRKYEAPGCLSRETLRAIFGAKYWERSWAIKLSAQFLPAPGQSPIRERQMVVETPDHPDGLPALVRCYQQGYALVVMDSWASYEGSARRAVIEALAHRIPGLVVGPHR